MGFSSLNMKKLISRPFLVSFAPIGQRASNLQNWIPAGRLWPEVVDSPEVETNVIENVSTDPPEQHERDGESEGEKDSASKQVTLDFRLCAKHKRSSVFANRAGKLCIRTGGLLLNTNMISSWSCIRKQYEQNIRTVIINTLYGLSYVYLLEMPVGKFRFHFSVDCWKKRWMNRRLLDQLHLCFAFSQFGVYESCNNGNIPDVVQQVATSGSLAGKGKVPSARRRWVGQTTTCLCGKLSHILKDKTHIYK